MYSARQFCGAQFSDWLPGYACLETQTYSAYARASSFETSLSRLLYVLSHISPLLTNSSLELKQI